MKHDSKLPSSAMRVGMFISMIPKPSNSAVFRVVPTEMKINRLYCKSCEIFQLEKPKSNSTTIILINEFYHSFILKECPKFRSGKDLVE